MYKAGTLTEQEAFERDRERERAGFTDFVLQFNWGGVQREGGHKHKPKKAICTLAKSMWHCKFPE